MYKLNVKIEGEWKVVEFFTQKELEVFLRHLQKLIRSLEFEVIQGPELQYDHSLKIGT